MMNLQHPHTVAYYAALYEADQAYRDYSETHEEFISSGGRAGSPLDYAVWSTAGYAHTAHLAVRDMPVWEA